MSFFRMLQEGQEGVEHVAEALALDPLEEGHAALSSARPAPGVEGAASLGAHGVCGAQSL